MAEGEDRKSAPERPKLNMGGSLGALPTENLLQMIGNLRLSARLLLEDPSTKEFCLLTFREGELAPEIESSHYPSLVESLSEDDEVDKQHLSELVVAHSELPLWNRILVAGIADRETLKYYLIDGVRLTLKKFSNLGGLHFELAPVPTERLGTAQGFPVSEICALARRPKDVAMPPGKTKEEEKIQPSPANTPSPPLAGQSDFKTDVKAQPQERRPAALIEPSEWTDLLVQLREAVTGMMACFLLDAGTKTVKASSATPMLDDNPDFHFISNQVFERINSVSDDMLNVNELLLLTEEYVIGINYLTKKYSLLAICRKGTPLGLLLTGLRRAAQRAKALLKEGDQ